MTWASLPNVSCTVWKLGDWRLASHEFANLTGAQTRCESAVILDLTSGPGCAAGVRTLDHGPECSLRGGLDTGHWTGRNAQNIELGITKHPENQHQYKELHREGDTQYNPLYHKEIDCKDTFP